jgi:hypothetical protein
MDQHSKSELIKSYRKRYQRASKKDKTRIINAIVEATGYCRKHIIRAMAQEVAVPRKVTRTRISRYAYLYEALKFVWACSNFLCGKRLAPFLPELVESLERHGEICLSPEDKEMLLTASAATLDRLLAPARREVRLRGRSTTKPGTILRNQIPVRTFADWNDDRPGFLEIDLVAHCGESNSGEYINTLNMTDISTGWTVSTAFMGRSERFCVAAIDEVRPLLPFAVLGLDSDNGSEFINYHLKSYCERNKITFTRSRPWKKNDSAHIEQKNWDVVRKMIGYGRLDNNEQLDMLKRIYNLLGLYQNYFQPSRKLQGKTRIGAKLRKKYDRAQTPLQRLLSRDDIPDMLKDRLQNTFHELNPAQLLRTINELICELYNL